MPFDLAYGRRIYGFWGRHPRLYWAGDWPIFFGRRAEIRRRAVDASGLKGGEAVLELACGPGINFPLLERAIGTSGKLTALDYSEEMLAAARKRAQGEGWQNVELVQGDAARTELPAESFDAALCTLGLSVIPDHQGAIGRVLAALKGGGRFVVLDGQPGPLRGRAGWSTRRSSHCSGACTTRTSRRISFETWSEPSMRWPWTSSTVGVCSSPTPQGGGSGRGGQRMTPATKGAGDGRLEASEMLRASQKAVLERR